MSRYEFHLASRSLGSLGRLKRHLCIRSDFSFRASHHPNPSHPSNASSEGSERSVPFAFSSFGIIFLVGMSMLSNAQVPGVRQGWTILYLTEMHSTISVHAKLRFAMHPV